MFPNELLHMLKTFTVCLKEETTQIWGRRVNMVTLLLHLQWHLQDRAVLCYPDLYGGTCIYLFLNGECGLQRRNA